MEKDCAFANLEDKYTFKFKEQQKVAVESILDGKDTFILVMENPRFIRICQKCTNLLNV
jgi:hypothetical protein